MILRSSSFKVDDRLLELIGTGLDEQRFWDMARVGWRDGKHRLYLTRLHDSECHLLDLIRDVRDDTHEAETTQSSVQLLSICD